MEHLTLEKISMLLGQLQLSILNLENYVQKLEEQIRELENNKNYQKLRF
jgi:hypothetical protein